MITITITAETLGGQDSQWCLCISFWFYWNPTKKQKPDFVKAEIHKKGEIREEAAVTVDTREPANEPQRNQHTQDKGILWRQLMEMIGVLGSLSRLSVGFLTSAQVLISGAWVGAHVGLCAGCEAYLKKCWGRQGDSVDQASNSWFQLRPWYHNLWVYAPHPTLCWQHGACLGCSLSLSLYLSPAHSLSLSLKINK